MTEPNQSQMGEAQSGSSRKGLNTKLILVAVAVIAVVAVLLAVMLMGSGTNGNGNTIKVGDFLKYQGTTVPVQEPHNITIVILGINSTHFYYKVTEEYGGHSSTNYMNQTKNQTMFAIDPAHPPAGTTMTYVGQDTITFSWGARSADKYTYQSGGQSGTIWLRNGVMVKYLVVITESSMTMLLIDSNMSQVR